MRAEGGSRMERVAVVMADGATGSAVLRIGALGQAVQRARTASSLVWAKQQQAGRRLHTHQNGSLALDWMLFESLAACPALCMCLRRAACCRGLGSPVDVMSASCSRVNHGQGKRRLYQHIQSTSMVHSMPS